RGAVLAPLHPRGPGRRRPLPAAPGARGRGRGRARLRECAWRVTVQELRGRAPSLAVAVRQRLDLTHALSWLVAASSIVFVAGFLLAAYFRLTYPYPIWVMEAPSLQAVRRILGEGPLYGPPSLEYVPTLYAP